MAKKKSQRKQRLKKEDLYSPKGMRDISGEEYYLYQGFFMRAQEIAEFYGLKPIEMPILEREEVFTKGVGSDTDIEKEIYRLRAKKGRSLAMRPEGTAGVMRAYIQHGMHTLPQPVMLYYYGPFFRHERPQRGRYREMRQFGIEILGTEKSFADALAMRVTLSILEEAGGKDLMLILNSIGCRECRPEYVKSLVDYYKKHTEEICYDCKKRLKTNPLRLLDCKKDKCAPIKEEAPDSLNHLCSQCKEHFKKVLEYTEAMEVPYQLDKTLVRGIDYYSRTVFEVVGQDAPATVEARTQSDKNDTENSEEATEQESEGKEEAPEKPESDAEEIGNGKILALAGGGRYNYLAEALGARKSVPSVGAAIGVDRVVLSSWFNKKLKAVVLKDPKFYFIRLGTEAKLKSLKILEDMRRAKIPVVQSISTEKIGAQLSRAEKLKIPYVILLGQKEAVDNSIIIRDMKTRSQKTIPVDDLLDYLKKLK